MSGRSEIPSGHISEEMYSPDSAAAYSRHRRQRGGYGLWRQNRSFLQSLQKKLSEPSKSHQSSHLDPSDPTPFQTPNHPPLRSPHSKADTFPYSQLVMIAHLTRLMAVLSILLGEPVVNAWVFMPVVVVLSGLQ
jgi:hypothetical protein